MNIYTKKDPIRVLGYNYTNYTELGMVEGDGFEPPNPKEQIYSLPRLASSLPLHANDKEDMSLLKIW
jgi:hypothetical protein